jgi:hypothetical protein
LFGEESKNNIKLDEGFWKDGEKVTSEENRHVGKIEKR